MKNLKFLWRENYVDYLWATETTAKSYFFDSGYLIYRTGVLSAYATEKEIKRTKIITKDLSTNPSKILEILKNFNEVKADLRIYHNNILNLFLSKISNKKLFLTFKDIISLYNRFIDSYGFTEAHMLDPIEKIAKDVVYNIYEDETDRILAKLLSNPESITKFNLDEHRDLFLLVKRISKIRFEAKRITDNLLIDTEKILIETSRRTNYAVNQISSMSLKELEELLINNKKIDTSTLNSRINSFGLEIKVEDKVVSIKELSHQQIALIENIDKNISKEITGDIVYPGKITGRVRLVKKLFSKDDYSKFMSTIEKGDILVASMTSPNLTPCFSKISGIITDEGGLMSHAALISREKKIPCIVGTRNATHVLNDYDVVELNANEGKVLIK